MTSKKIFLKVVVTLIIFSAGCSNFGRLIPTPEPVTIRFSFIGNAEVFTALAQEFHEANPHITVALDEIMRYRNDADNGEVIPDVIRVMPFFDLENSSENFLPLGDLLSFSEVLSPADFFPGSLVALQEDGEQLGIPAGISQMVMFFNILRFKIADLDPPPSNWDLNDFVNLASQLQEQGKSLDTRDDVVYGYCPLPDFDDLKYFTYLTGGQFFDQLPHPTRPTLNLPANIEALKWYLSLTDTYQITPPMADGRQAFQDIYDYRCGFWMNIMELPMLMNMREEEVGILPMPKSRAAINLASLESYHILKSSPFPLEAWQWIEFLVTHPTSAGGVLPPLPKQLSNQEFINQASPAEKEIIQQLNESTVFLTMEFYQDPLISQVFERYDQAVQQVMFENEDIQAALDAAQLEAETIFAQFSSP